MVIRIDLKDIKAQWLNARCLNTIAKYSKLAYEADETRIRLSSDDCLKMVVDHAKQTRDPELRAIFRELKKELQSLLRADHLQPKLDALAQYQEPESYKVDDLCYF